jgi:DNA-binding response OmpR family regulator
MESMVNVLLVEDDRRLSALLARRLSDEGYPASTSASGLEGLALARSGRFQLLVLDRMLPGMDGVSVVQELRASGIQLPVLMLTAKDTVEDRVEGLRGGADDYLVKPFAFTELLARIEALTRRLGNDARLTVGPVDLDPASRRVRVSGQEVELTAREFDLLECLLRNTGRVLTRAELKDAVWDFDFEAETKVVDLYVHYLRKKLGGAAGVIETVRGVGYAVGR